MKKWLQGIIAICSILIISACGSSGDNEQVEEPEIEEPTVEISDEEKLTDDEVVVLVNDNEVHGKRYNIIYPQIKMYATQMEEDVELDEIKERTIDALIDQELIYQGAEEEGIVVTEEDIEKKFTELKEENEEGLTSLMEQFHMTEEAFKDQLKFEETMEQYVELKIDIEVSDEEIEEYYNEVKEQNDQIPDLAEVEEQIKAQLEKERTDEALEEIVLELKEEATIEKKI